MNVGIERSGMSLQRAAELCFKAQYSFFLLFILKTVVMEGGNKCGGCYGHFNRIQIMELVVSPRSFSRQI